MDAGTPPVADLSVATAERILGAFLELVAERGIEATTTRLLAQRAGVNEVTIFRHFGDKRSLARAAVRRWLPADLVAAYPLAIDASRPACAAAGLLGVLRFLREMMRERRALLQFGLGEYWRFPELRDEIGSAPLGGRDLIERALRQAAPALRPEVDIPVTALTWMGLIFASVVWQARGWLDWSDADCERALRAAIRPLLRDGLANREEEDEP